MYYHRRLTLLNCPCSYFGIALGNAHHVMVPLQLASCGNSCIYCLGFSGVPTWRNSPGSPSHKTCLWEQVCWSDTGLLSHWPQGFNRILGTLWGEITAPNSWLWPVSASSNHGYSGLGGATIADWEWRHQKSVLGQQEKSTGFILKQEQAWCDWQAEVRTLGQKGISFNPFLFVCFF